MTIYKINASSSSCNSIQELVATAIARVAQLAKALFRLLAYIPNKIVHAWTARNVTVITGLVKMEESKTSAMNTDSIQASSMEVDASTKKSDNFAQTDEIESHVAACGLERREFATQAGSVHYNSIASGLSEQKPQQAAQTDEIESHVAACGLERQESVVQTSLIAAQDASIGQREEAVFDPVEDCQEVEEAAPKASRPNVKKMIQAGVAVAAVAACYFAAPNIARGMDIAGVALTELSARAMNYTQPLLNLYYNNATDFSLNG